MQILARLQRIDQAMGKATECAVMTCASRLLVLPLSYHDRWNLPPQSQTS